jgi:hypothetical protein
VPDGRREGLKPLGGLARPTKADTAAAREVRLRGGGPARKARAAQNPWRPTWGRGICGSWTPGDHTDGASRGDSAGDAPARGGRGPGAPAAEGHRPAGASPRARRALDAGGGHSRPSAPGGRGPPGPPALGVAIRGARPLVSAPRHRAQRAFDSWGSRCYWLGGGTEPRISPRNVASHSPLNTRVRICSQKCAPRGVQAICWRLQKCLLTI